MALKEIATTGATLTYSSPVTGAPPTLGPPSLKVKAGGAAVLLDQIQVTIPPGATNGTCTTTVAGIGNLAATAQKVQIEGKPPIRTGDKATVSAVTGTTPDGKPCTLAITVEVAMAGQTKVMAG